MFAKEPSERIEVLVVYRIIACNADCKKSTILGLFSNTRYHLAGFCDGATSGGLGSIGEAHKPLRSMA